MLEEDQEHRIARIIAGHIQDAKDFIIEHQLGVFKKCDPALA
jgi:catalase